MSSPISTTSTGTIRNPPPTPMIEVSVPIRSAATASSTRRRPGTASGPAVAAEGSASRAAAGPAGRGAPRALRHMAPPARSATVANRTSCVSAVTNRDSRAPTIAPTIANAPNSTAARTFTAFCRRCERNPISAAEPTTAWLIATALLGGTPSA
jgi:hypothetical protein